MDVLGLLRALYLAVEQMSTGILRAQLDVGGTMLSDIHWRY